MSHNKPYIKFKFKLMFANMSSPTMYALLHNGKYTKTYTKENEIVSDIVSKEEYASALAHIMLRENGFKYIEDKL